MQTRPIRDADSPRAQIVTGDAPAPVAASVAPPADDDDAKAGGYAWVWPVNKAPVMRGFGQQGSKGVDFGGVVGQPVFAAAPGRVVYSGNALKGYGELIIRSEEHTSELQSLMRRSYAVLCLKKNNE